jgi:hypothetical protein
MNDFPFSASLIGIYNFERYQSLLAQEANVINYTVFGFGVAPAGKYSLDSKLILGSRGLIF